MNMGKVLRAGSSSGRFSVIPGKSQQWIHRPRAHTIRIPRTAEAGGLPPRQEQPDSLANGGDLSGCGVTETNKMSTGNSANKLWRRSVSRVLTCRRNFTTRANFITALGITQQYGATTHFNGQSDGNYAIGQTRAKL
jgi:hypothetical protein